MNLDIAHDDAVRQLWLDGASLTQIGEKLGLTKGQVSNRVTRMGLPKRKGSGVRKLKNLPRPKKSIHNTQAARPVNRVRAAPTPYGMSPGFNGTHDGHGCLFIKGEDFKQQIRDGIDPHCNAPAALTVEGVPLAYCGRHWKLTHTRTRDAF